MNPMLLDGILQGKRIGWQPDANTVLWLPGYEGAGSLIRDYSGKGNHGTIYGATWVRSDKGLWVLDCDGTDDFVSIANTASLQFGTSDFSVEFWVYLGHNGVGYQGDLIGMYDAASSNNSWGFAFSASTNIRNYDGPGAHVDMPVDACALTWKHFLITFKPSEDKVYYWQNGVAKTAINVADQSYSSTLNLTIGKYTRAQWSFCKNKMRLLRLYNTGQDIVTAQSHFQQERHLFGV